MMTPKVRKYIKIALWVLCVVCVLYGMSRLYYRVTGGFTEGNITYNLAYDPRWDVHQSTQQIVDNDQIFSQPFYYLGKGCQSYVFQSADEQYVLKFFKYQRFRPQEWLSWFSFIPPLESYRQDKIQKKKQKLENVFISWKIAYEELPKETGVVYVHLNKTDHLKRSLTLYDKMGLEHKLDLDRYEFLVQRKATLLAPTLDEMMSQGKETESKLLIDRLISLLLDEFERGYADNDHALMQNTGVLDGFPIHIDVGQFVRNSRVKRPEVWHQELFNKMWKFSKWLEKTHPSLAIYLEGILKEKIGENAFASLRPRLNKAEMGIIPHQP
jgi:hypothetical protein